MNYGDKMTHTEALIEWESGGLGDIPTANLLEFMDVLKQELELRNKFSHNETGKIVRGESTVSLSERVRELEERMRKVEEIIL
jgi:hypothetical protein